MRRFKNECCGCAAPGYPCLGNGCPRINVEHFYCDKCLTETKLYEYEGEELCAECILKSLPQIEGSTEN